ncbi:hypothetical protein [Pontibacter harenae]|uniref:hypothetical protein n=1 Tax=Pontibacter harenae TaxID=2894083 RepID=UPI001E37C542|nr:hypothetical protein [Pontibacter harenae]MCC9165831.1 hypothetical protein [Pontibacter harenae]
MTDNKNKRQKQHKSISNSDKSVDAGGKGVKLSTALDSLQTNTLNGSKIVNDGDLSNAGNSRKDI